MLKSKESGNTKTPLLPPPLPPPLFLLTWSQLGGLDAYGVNHVVTGVPAASGHMPVSTPRSVLNVRCVVVDMANTDADAAAHVLGAAAA